MGRVLEDLGIRVIHARSPQAKGRVERLFGTLQDRLCAELRLAGLHAGSSMADADRALWAYLPRFNARFAVPAAVPAAAPETAYRPLAEVLPKGVPLDQLCCFKYERTVGMDNTVRFGDRRLQLGPGPHRRSDAKARVEVHERLDGSLAVSHDGTVLVCTPAPTEAPLLRARHLPRPPRLPRPDAAPSHPPPPAPAALEPPDAPSAPHPWRRKGYFATDGPLPFRRTAGQNR